MKHALIEFSLCSQAHALRNTHTYIDKYITCAPVCCNQLQLQYQLTTKVAKCKTMAKMIILHTHYALHKRLKRSTKTTTTLMSIVGEDKALNRNFIGENHAGRHICIHINGIILTYAYVAHICLVWYVVVGHSIGFTSLYQLVMYKVSTYISKYIFIAQPHKLL